MYKEKMKRYIFFLYHGYQIVFRKYASTLKNKFRTAELICMWCQNIEK